MSSVFDNPSFYISIFSSICFISSEILPFLPIKANGILHAILECLNSYNKQQNKEEINLNPISSEDISEIKIISSKIDQVLEKLDHIKG